MTTNSIDENFALGQGIGIYVHIPFCKSRCSYCSFVSGCPHEKAGEYTSALSREIAAHARGERADTVYIGGGTPSTLPRGKLSEIFSALRTGFEIADNAEITVECNPDSSDGKFFDECVSSGVNRVSIGLQSTEDSLLKKVNRPHDFGQFVRAVTEARAHGIQNISADLMLGLPEQTKEQSLISVEKIVALGLPHVSVYGLSVEKGTPLEKSGYRVDEDACADMYAQCADYLKKNGYIRYEVSNFGRKGYASRHNMKYWKREPYFGFGLAAHSFDGETRSANTSLLGKYLAGECEQERTALSLSDRKEETIMLSLRTADGLDVEAYNALFAADLFKEKKSEIARLKAHGLIDTAGGRLRLTENAYYVMNAVIVALI